MTVFTLFPGVDGTLLIVVLVVLTSSVLLVLLALGMNQPVLLRMGLRHLLRRPRQTLLLLAGLILSTVVMTASFGLWESLLNNGVKVASGKQLFAGTAGCNSSGCFPFSAACWSGWACCCWPCW